MSYFLTLAFILGFVKAQSHIYGQCGGKDWTGPKTCETGTTCVYFNDYYSQCLQRILY